MDQWGAATSSTSWGPLAEAASSSDTPLVFRCQYCKETFREERQLAAHESFAHSASITPAKRIASERHKMDPRDAR